MFPQCNVIKVFEILGTSILKNFISKRYYNKVSGNPDSTQNKQVGYLGSGKFDKALIVGKESRLTRHTKITTLNSD